jgi:ABC-type phosphate transport system substrate-binding protein
MKNITAIMMFVLLSVSSAALAGDYILITDNSNPVTTISAKDVKNVYLGKKTVWSDGSHITVFTQTSSSVNKAFMKEMARKTPQQYATYWKKSLFTGTGLPPKDFTSDESIKAAVAAKPGSIGYIQASALDDTVKQLDIN